MTERKINPTVGDFDGDVRTIIAHIARARKAPACLVTIDTVGAGFRETVLVVSGSSARLADGMKDRPVDAAIVGIIDTVEVTD